MKYIYLIALFFIVTYSNSVKAQCGGSEFCNGNTGLYSNDDATNIAYDNMGSSYHSTFIKEPNGEWKVWVSNMNQNGSTAALSPLSINATNYPNLTGIIYKVAIGSRSAQSQLIVLTSDGIFVGGAEGVVISNLITASSTFDRITVNGKADGLPEGVNADEVKMLFATTGALIITTCAGEVYVLSTNPILRQNWSAGTETQWSKVMQDATLPLTNVIVSRGTVGGGYALKSNGALWTWGAQTFLGDGSALSLRNFATQMTLPPGMPGIKMIQATRQVSNSS